MIFLAVPTVRADLSRIKYDEGSSEDGGMIRSPAYHEQSAGGQIWQTPLDRGKDVQTAQSKRVAIIGKSCVDTSIHHGGLIILPSARESC